MVRGGRDEVDVSVEVHVDVAWVSKHAMERYRLHFPEAVATDVIAAIDLSIPLRPQLADALAGRRRRQGPVEGEARLLHPAGTGVFVLCELREEPGRMYVKTYLRLDGSEQRRMARGWFLEPLQILQKAFELGYLAAQEPDAPPLAVQASKAHVDALVALAPRLGAPVLGTAFEEQSTVQIRPQSSLNAAGLFVSAGEQSRRVLADLAASQPGFQADLRQWVDLDTEALQRLLGEPHIQEQGVHRGWVEPSGMAALLYRPDEHEDSRRIGVVSVPRRLRAQLVGEVSPIAVPEQALEAATELIAPIEPPDPEQLVWASELRIRSWGGRARREAETSGIGVIPAAWLGELESVDPVELAMMVPLLGWRLGPSAVYGALRAGNAILLVRRAESNEAATVVRCTVLPESRETVAGYDADTSA